jgi:hypothetical protein
MAAEMPQERVGYEQALRVIGRQLDAEPSYHLSILEVADGFTVRYQPSQQRSDAHSVHYSWERLRDLNVFQAAARGIKRKRGRYHAMWAKFPNGHQDLLRSLGATLDRDRASSLSVDEVPEGIAVSYLRPDPGNTLRSQKAHQILRDEDVQGILEEAQHRRSQGLEPLG